MPTISKEMKIDRLRYCLISGRALLTMTNEEDCNSVTIAFEIVPEDERPIGETQKQIIRAAHALAMQAAACLAQDIVPMSVSAEQSSAASDLHMELDASHSDRNKILEARVDDLETSVLTVISSLCSEATARAAADAEILKVAASASEGRA